jgi:hypothetical protein
MPRVGFKPLIPVFEPEKTFHVLDLAATVSGAMQNLNLNIFGHYYNSHKSVAISTHKSLTQVRLNNTITNSIHHSLPDEIIGCFLIDLNFFFNLHSGWWNQDPLDTAAT